MALSKTTQDHDEIRQWAEARGALPAEVASTEKNGQTGIIRIEFPKAKDANDSALKELSWDEFFEKFDASGLALVYQEQTADGEKSNFNKLIHPDEAALAKSASKTASSKKSPGAARKSASAKSAKKTAAKAPARKAPAKKSASKRAPAKKVLSKKTPSKSAPAKKSAGKSAAKKAGRTR